MGIFFCPFTVLFMGLKPYYCIKLLIIVDII
nr:MAG TPA: hypothetical protein [Caudoviricetes sp.]